MSNLLAHPYELLTKEQIETSVKARAARVNALKSTGPRTPAGKAISARNAFKHGFAGAKLTIDESEQQAFNDHLDTYFLRFKPQDQVEADAVRRTAEAHWKMDTINATENAIMSLEGGFQMVLADAKLDPEQITVHHYRALALIEQASDGRALDLCHRYHLSAAREYDRALRTFYHLRDERDRDAAASIVPELIAPTNSQPEPHPKPDQPQPQPQQNQKVPNEPKTGSSSSNNTVTAAVDPHTPVNRRLPLQFLPNKKAA
jgi:hypothetical protein